MSFHVRQKLDVRELVKYPEGDTARLDVTGRRDISFSILYLGPLAVFQITDRDELWIAQFQPYTL
jgi:hypothetical protein